MATPQSIKPDLSTLRIGDDQPQGCGGAGKRIVITVLPLVILAGIGAAAYAFRNQKAVVEVATAAKSRHRERQSLLNASGYVTPRRRATIAAKITGRVTGVFFDEGTHVRQGQLLATLDDSDVKRALESAKADRELRAGGDRGLRGAVEKCQGSSWRAPNNCRKRECRRRRRWITRRPLRIA